MASNFPDFLGIPADLLSVLGACGVRHWPGHHVFRCSCVSIWRILGKQAQELQFSCWYVLR